MGVQEGCRFLYVGDCQGQKNFIYMYKNGNVHPRNSKVALKNLTGFLYHSNTNVMMWKFEKQNNGIHKENCFGVFKQNVKEIKSKDFEHYAKDVQFIYLLSKMLLCRILLL